MRFRRTTLIFGFCLAILAGLGLSRRINFAPGYFLLLLAPAFLVVKRKNLFALLIVLFVGLGMGLWRGGAYMQNIHKLQSLSQQKITIEATATTDSIYGKRAQIQFSGNHIKLL